MCVDLFISDYYDDDAKRDQDFKLMDDLIYLSMSTHHTYITDGAWAQDIKLPRAFLALPIYLSDMAVVIHQCLWPMSCEC